MRGRIVVAYRQHDVAFKLQRKRGKIANKPRSKLGKKLEKLETG